MEEALKLAANAHGDRPKFTAAVHAMVRRCGK
jgi:hypothetical protein